MFATRFWSLDSLNELPNNWTIPNEECLPFETMVPWRVGLDVCCPRTAYAPVSIAVSTH